MRISEMPEWVLKHKTKGYTVRYQDNQYVLLRVTSKRVSDKSYPILIQENIGIITKEGIIPKKVSVLDKTIQLEFGLTSFIYKNLKRTLQRKIYSNELTSIKDAMISASILSYVFNTYKIDCKNITYFTTLLPITDYSHLTQRRLNNLKSLIKVIDSFFNQHFTDIEEKQYFINLLRNITIAKDKHISTVFIPEEVKNIIKEKELKNVH
jgi:hypothetical protein